MGAIVWPLCMYVCCTRLVSCVLNGDVVLLTYIYFIRARRLICDVYIVRRSILPSPLRTPLLTCRLTSCGRNHALWSDLPCRSTVS